MYALTGFCPDIRRFFLMMSKHTRVTVAQSPSGMEDDSSGAGGLDAITRATLEYWKDRPVRPTDIPFQRAVDSLASDRPLVQFRKQSPARWVVR